VCDTNSAATHSHAAALPVIGMMLTVPCPTRCYRLSGTLPRNLTPWWSRHQHACAPSTASRWASTAAGRSAHTPCVTMCMLF
jgi:hypothetical protein